MPISMRWRFPQAIRKGKEGARQVLLLLLTLSIVLPWQPVAQAVAPDTLANGGFEQAGSTASLAYDWQAFGRGYTRVTTAHSGTWGIRLTNTSSNQQSGAYQRVDLAQTEKLPVFIGGYVRGANILKSSGSYFGASLYAEIHLANGSVAYWNSIANVGTFSWRWIGFSTGTVPGVTGPIDYIFVIPILANATGTGYFDDITLTEFTPSQAAVTLMFDDGEDTTYTQAKPVLDEYGFAGTSAVITGSVGTDGFMTYPQLSTLQTSGWEIVSHSITHRDMTKLSSWTIQRELQNSKNTLVSHGLQVSNFAFPYGAYSGYLLAEAAKYYRSARAYEQGTNPQGAFPFEVKVRGLLSTTSLSEVEAWLADAQSNGRWVLLVFHTIAPTGDDAYHTSPQMLKDIVAKVASSGLPVVTYNQALNLFGVAP